MRRVLAWFACLALAACANGYSQFYTPAPAASLAQLDRFEGVPTVIESTGDLEGDIGAMFTRGYGALGFSNFNGPTESVAGAVAQGKSVGAQYVVVSRQFARTVQGSIPMTTFAPQTTYTNGTVNAFGPGGSATGNYSGTSTTYTQQTTYIPFTIDRYDQKALYFGPIARKGVGILVSEIDPRNAQRLGTQKGVIVRAVRRGSPAFNADILPGDVLMDVAGQTVFDQEMAFARLRAAYGTDVVVTILRAGQQLQKTLSLPPDGVWL